MKSAELTIVKTEPKVKTKGFRRPILEILEDLQKPVPARLIKSKTIKGKKIDYIPWYTLCRLLDYYTPGYDWQVKTHYHGERVVVEGTLIIKAEEGDFVRQATGTELSECDNYGDPTSNSEAMALRRCCAKFGLGLSLWEAK